MQIPEQLGMWGVHSLPPHHSDFTDAFTFLSHISLIPLSSYMPLTVFLFSPQTSPSSSILSLLSYSYQHCNLPRPLFFINVQHSSLFCLYFFLYVPTLATNIPILLVRLPCFHTPSNAFLYLTLLVFIHYFHASFRVFLYLALLIFSFLYQLPSSSVILFSLCFHSRLKHLLVSFLFIFFSSLFQRFPLAHSPQGIPVFSINSLHSLSYFSCLCSNSCLEHLIPLDIPSLLLYSFQHGPLSRIVFHFIYITLQH